MGRIAQWALSSLRYRIANFALQRTFRFTPLGLAFCFFPFSNTHLAEVGEKKRQERERARVYSRFSVVSDWGIADQERESGLLIGALCGELNTHSASSANRPSDLLGLQDDRQTQNSSPCTDPWGNNPEFR